MIGETENIMANGHVQPGRSLEFYNDTGADIKNSELFPYGGGVAAKALGDIPAGTTGVVTLHDVHRVPVPDGMTLERGQIVRVNGGRLSDSGDILGRFVGLDKGGWAKILIMPLSEGGGGGGTSDIAWKPAVSADGVITWTRSSSTAAPTPQNIKGEKGDKGDPGEKGDPGTGEAFVATYGTTTAQEIIAHLEGDSPLPMFVERSGSYYTVTTAAKQAANKIIIRTFATLGGEYYMFTYTVTDGTWAGASQGFQYKLESGTNLKTVGGNSLLGAGDIPLPSGGATDWADITNKPENLVQDADYVHTDANYTAAEKTKLARLSNYDDTALAGRVTTLETDKVTVTAASIPGGGGGEEVVVSVQEAGDQTGAKVLGVRYFTDGQGGVLGDPALIVGNENFSLGVTVDSALDSASRNPVENRVVNQALAEKQNTPAYIVDKPSGASSQLGNVVQVGTFQDNDGTEYGIYEFYYRTTALPTADATIEYTLLPLLADYTILDFVDATGVTSNGVFVGNGRTDGTNRLIVQQFSKVRKAVILRAYQDYSAQTALLKIKFIGTKTTA